MKLSKDNKKLLESLYLEASEIFYAPLNPGSIKYLFDKINFFIVGINKNKKLFKQYEKIIKYNDLAEYLISSKLKKYMELMNPPENPNVKKLKEQIDAMNWMPLDQYDFTYNPEYIISSVVQDIEEIRRDIKDILDYSNDKNKFKKEQDKLKKFLKLFQS